MDKFAFHPVIWRWFEERFGSPTEPQEQGWPAIQSGRHTLISAPTGSGKTLAAFFASLDQLFREGLEWPLPDETRVLYVSPLKALSNDIHKNLEEPLAGIGQALATAGLNPSTVRAEVRTGDTPASRRQAIAKKPPHILVTTPESFYLLLTSVSGRRMLQTVRVLIVDEIHALAGNRRGSHLAISMERLAALTGRPLQRIGLSATQKPVDLVARFLIGNDNSPDGAESASEAKVGPIQPQFDSGFTGLTARSGLKPAPGCVIIDTAHRRRFDMEIELPGSPLEAVMSNEVWEEVYKRLAGLIESHRTTLVFVNTRRLAERVTHHLSGLLGEEAVASHHGSLSAKIRLDAEQRLKAGKLRALVATSSLELGIDIGSVDLVCQIGSTRSIAALLQRVGRAEHRRGGLPKGRLFPLSRDELAECAALLRAVRCGKLDRLIIPEKPLDILAQQIVACAASGQWSGGELFQTMRRAWPYQDLTRAEFDRMVKMLAEGFSTKRGRRGALIHYDAVNDRLRGRRGARLVALTSGGAIPDNADYRVVLEPSETFIGTVNEDFAIESMAGDIFQLGNASWRILRVNSGTVRVEDAKGLPPSIPFWLGEAPARTDELSRTVSNLRAEIEAIFSKNGGGEAETSRDAVMAWLMEAAGIPERVALQLAEYFAAAYKVLGAIPNQKKLVMERFFDESGGMQLIIHSPFGSRINRAWGLSLRKRFCRSFNFELQAAATDDAIVMSLGTQHSFPLDEVFRYLKSASVRDILVQALLDAPMFKIRWRWNSTRSLAIPRMKGGRRLPAPLQRMEAENLIAAVFPDQLACLENIAGDREVPDHPLVRQTIEDCLVEAMDIEGLIRLLKNIEEKRIECLAFDLPEPSPLAHEVLNARPYAFLDNAPLEERRTQAVYTRRALEGGPDSGLGILDEAAIRTVTEEAWPKAAHADELHEALLLAVLMTESEVSRVAENWRGYLRQLEGEGRCGVFRLGETAFWVAAERLSISEAIHPEALRGIKIEAPASEAGTNWERPDAIRELVRGRVEISGPVTAPELAEFAHVPSSEIDAALLALEAEGFVLRGRFRAGATETEWCDRRLLARIHRLTINRLRAEIEPVSVNDFLRFLLTWQRAGSGSQGGGPDALDAVLKQLDGYELPAASWETDVLPLRLHDYDPQWLDRLCFSGRVGWGRLNPPPENGNRAAQSGPIRSSPVSLFLRDHLDQWLALSPTDEPAEFSLNARQVFDVLRQAGALFFNEIARRSGLLPSLAEQALGELVTLGLVTADSFDGLRALLQPARKKGARTRGGRRRSGAVSIEYAGRWSLLPRANASETASQDIRDRATEIFARALLVRYGVVFRRLLEREAFKVSWYELGRVFRRMEARGEIRGGHFVGGVSGEQFALPEAIGLLRSVRKKAGNGELIAISAADPLNLVGILTPGPRVAAIGSNRILLRDGVPVACLEAGNVRMLDESLSGLGPEMERALRVGKLPKALRALYA